MPIVVTCRCGKQFAAKDHHFGRQVPCPACGDALVIGAAANSPPAIYVSCACGRVFVAPEHMRGEIARCHGCGRPIQVPGPEPLGVLGVPGRHGSPVPLAMLPAHDTESDIPWDTLKRIGKLGGGVLLMVILVTTTIDIVKRKPWRSVAEKVSALTATVKSTRPEDLPAVKSLLDAAGKKVPGAEASQGGESVPATAAVANAAAPAEVGADGIVPTARPLAPTPHAFNK